MKTRLLPLLAIALLLPACRRDNPVPKPYGYLRIDMPEHAYQALDTLRSGDSRLPMPGAEAPSRLPFTFEMSKAAVLTAKQSPKDEVWLDIEYPSYNGVVFLTHKRLAGPADLRGQVDTSLRLLEKHYQRASGVKEKDYADPGNRVFGTTYALQGSAVASTFQFWMTDSSSHFLRGALYINATPNNDSLAPVIQYIQDDIVHLVETLRWR